MLAMSGESSCRLVVLILNDECGSLLSFPNGGSQPYNDPPRHANVASPPSRSKQATYIYLDRLLLCGIMILILRHDSLCQGHHVRLLHPVRFAGTPPPDPLQTPGISPPRACPLINLFALPFFSITYELPNLQALCFDIYTKCRGCGGPVPVLASRQLSLFTSASLCVLGVSALSFSALFHQSPFTNHKSRLSNFSAAPNSSPFQSLLTNKNRLCYTEPVLGKLAS